MGTFTEAQYAETARLNAISRHTRRSLLAEPVSALNALHGRLVEAAMLYDAGDLQDQRDAVSGSILAVMDFLRDQGFAPTTLAPLMRPALALVERENNSIDQMFAQRPREGRPKATQTEHQRTGILAALTEAWLMLHANDPYTQDVKLGQAVRHFKGHWFGNKLTKAKLKSAREIVSQEARDHPAVCQFVQFYGFIIETADKFGFENALPVVIHFLNDNQLGFGLGQGGISKTPPV